MKRFVSFLCAVALCFGCLGFFGCSADRSEILKVYMPGEYFDPEMYDAFEVWYQAQTGKKIEVMEITFETNEELFVKVEKSKADYDLLCPSDYMAEQLIAHGLVQKIDKDMIPTEALIRPEYLEVARVYDPELLYSVPYMYGTFGIMYDYSKIGYHIDSWDALFDADAPFKGKWTQKKSVREAYSSACIYAAREELSKLSDGFTNYDEAYKKRIQEIFEDESESTIATAKAVLKAQKKRLLKYEVDDGKFGLANGSLNGVGGLNWSCDAGYVMADYEDDDGKEAEGNRNLWYVIPKEGGNVYMDTFVISKYAGNPTAAQMFLQFVCTAEVPDPSGAEGDTILVPVANSYYAGAVSPVTEAYDYLYEEYAEDDEFFEGTEAGWKEMYMDMMFPSAETLMRCGVMKMYKQNSSKINLMFADIVG